MLYQLAEIIEDRKLRPREYSYTSALLESGQERILQKVGEECIELIIAASSQGDDRLIEEFADLLYHAYVLLASRGIRLVQVEDVLLRRHST